MMAFNCNEYFTPFQNFLIDIKESADSDRVAQLKYKIVCDGGKLADDHPMPATGHVVLRGTASVAILRRYNRMNQQHRWFDDVIAAIYYAEPVAQPQKSKPATPREFVAGQDLRLRASLRTFNYRTRLDGLLIAAHADGINLEQLFQDRRSGVLYSTLDMSAPADTILKWERGLAERRLYPELDPVAVIGTEPFERPDPGHTEILRGYGQQSRPGLYAGMSDRVSHLVDTLAVWAEEIRDQIPGERDPWRFTATFSFKPDLDRAEALAELHDALGDWGIDYSLKSERAVWTPIAGSTPPGPASTK